MLIVYSFLAIVMLSLALTAPSYKGLVAPSGYRTLLYADPLVAVFTSPNTTLIYWQGSRYRLGLEAVSSCYADNKIVLALADGSLYTINPIRGSAELYRLHHTLKPLSVSCSIDSLVATGIKENDIILIDFKKYTGYIIGEVKGASKPSIAVYSIKGTHYVVDGSNIIKFVDPRGNGIMILPELASIKGLTLSGDGLVAYGSWSDSGLLYRFNVGEALLINVPGRITSIDALACIDYRCTAIIIPHGDWPITVEYNKWAYISNAKILGVKPFIYHGSGATNTPWFSGEFIGVGTAVISILSTRSTIIGFNSTHALIWVEDSVRPPPTMSKIKIFHQQKREEFPAFPLAIDVSETSLESSTIPILVVKPHDNRLNIMITFFVITSPILVYLYRYYLSSLS